MATWTARLDDISPVTGGEGLQVSVTYYDATDTLFTTVLYAKAFVFPLDATTASMAAQIRATGRTARTGRDTAAALLVANPIGTTITVT